MKKSEIEKLTESLEEKKTTYSRKKTADITYIEWRSKRGSAYRFFFDEHGRPLKGDIDSHYTITPGYRATMVGAEIDKTPHWLASGPYGLGPVRFRIFAGYIGFEMFKDKDLQERLEEQKSFNN
ncbi:MAG: hypothetical protein Q8Q42_03090 [Nanoarchaeota archaeon]|nr:hypothetical protein [Nanoarchaeota archaeon]